MTGKIFKSIFLSAIAVFLVSITFVFGFSYSYYSNAAMAELKRESSYLVSGVEEYGREYLWKIQEKTIRITHIDTDGSVLYDTGVGESELSEVENHIEREEIKAALESGEGSAKRYSETNSRRTVYYAVRLSDGTVLRVASAHYGIVDMALEFISPIIIIFVLVLLFAYFIGKKLSSDIVKPISEFDPNRPEEGAIYEEMRPIVDKLASQNYRITRQMSELKIRQNEFVSITSNMSEGMMLINSKTFILSSNQSARAILDIEGEPPRSVLSLKLSDEFRTAIRSALSGTNGYVELSKGEKHYSIIVTPVIHEEIIEGAVIFIIDDTEKEQRETLRREFTSNVSHELKTPLTSISGFAELIRCGMAEGEEAKHFADNILSEAKRLITLVGDIIRLTQLDGGEIPYDGEVDLYAIANEVSERLQNLAEAKGVSLSVEGGATTVLGNTEIIEEMIYNLSDNAIKYNKEGGSVKIRVYTDLGQAAVSVKDNGIGIPKDKQDRVFERFYRVDKSHSKKIGGTGLGLSIVKHAAAYHKAQIALISEENAGTEIIIKFPDIK